jgi:hypothetical protein
MRGVYRRDAKIHGRGHARQVHVSVMAPPLSKQEHVRTGEFAGRHPHVAAASHAGNVWQE